MEHKVWCCSFIKIKICNVFSSQCVKVYYICSYYTDKFSVKLHVEQKPINSDLQIHWFSIHCGHIWVLHTKQILETNIHSPTYIHIRKETCFEIVCLVLIYACSSNWSLLNNVDSIDKRLYFCSYIKNVENICSKYIYSTNEKSDDLRE